MFKEKRTANWNWRGWWRASIDSFIYRICFKHQVKKNFVEKNFEEKFSSYLEFL